MFLLRRPVCRAGRRPSVTTASSPASAAASGSVWRASCAPADSPAAPPCAHRFASRRSRRPSITRRRNSSFVHVIPAYPVPFCPFCSAMSVLTALFIGLVPQYCCIFATIWYNYIVPYRAKEVIADEGDADFAPVPLSLGYNGSQSKRTLLHSRWCRP